jgi:hypothetical protein
VVSGLFQGFLRDQGTAGGRRVHGSTLAKPVLRDIAH